MRECDYLDDGRGIENSEGREPSSFSRRKSNGEKLRRRLRLKLNETIFLRKSCVNMRRSYGNNEKLLNESSKSSEDNENERNENKLRTENESTEDNNENTSAK